LEKYTLKNNYQQETSFTAPEGGQ